MSINSEIKSSREVRDLLELEILDLKQVVDELEIALSSAQAQLAEKGWLRLAEIAKLVELEKHSI